MKILFVTLAKEDSDMTFWCNFLIIFLFYLCFYSVLFCFFVTISSVASVSNQDDFTLVISPHSIVFNCLKHLFIVSVYEIDHVQLLII